MATEFWRDLKPITSVFKADARPEVYVADAPTEDERYYVPFTETVGSRQYTRVLALGGGLPIKAGNEVVGAVGVSGSPGQDDVCSKAGIDKVADLLK